MVDQTPSGDDAVAPVCPWCSAPLPDPSAENCPSCGATLVGGADEAVPGLTAVDPGAISRAVTPPRPRSRLLSWLSGESDDDDYAPAPPAGARPTGPRGPARDAAARARGRGGPAPGRERRACSPKPPLKVASSTLATGMASSPPTRTSSRRWTRTPLPPTRAPMRPPKAPTLRSPRPQPPPPWPTRRPPPTRTHRPRHRPDRRARLSCPGARSSPAAWSIVPARARGPHRRPAASSRHGPPVRGPRWLVARHPVGDR